jgi:hypothetical protein
MTGKTLKSVATITAKSIALSLIFGGLVSNAAASGSAVRLLFSVDAGGDQSLSDPYPDGDEGFECSDVYSSAGGVVPPGGRDGEIDDTTFLGTDVFPDAPDPTLTTGIPFDTGCTGSPQRCFDDYFDLDGIDIINVDLSTLVRLDTPVPTGEKIWRDYDFPDDASRACITSPRYLGISLDDDTAPSFVVGPHGAPTESLSPGGRTFGSTAKRDEVLAMTLTPSGSPSPYYAVVSTRGAASESHVHADLAPNPTVSTPGDDDDIDALDVVAPGVDCQVLLANVDHEADWGLSAGIIYQYDYSTGVWSQVLRPAVHFGLPPRTDIDAFELVWIPTESASGPVYDALAVLFSVDEDDPETGRVDESGGFEPGIIYGSFLDGEWFVAVDRFEREDVDAIAASTVDLKDWSQDDPNP